MSVIRFPITLLVVSVVIGVVTVGDDSIEVSRDKILVIVVQFANPPTFFKLWFVKSTSLLRVRSALLLIILPLLSAKLP